ncbi:metal-dependent phosphohydrolase [Oleiphilus messinensis]|uniref:Metal-dependent phosphohydrolase n=1 Tax=Oleiphilus messinensis TaxID=141451 RepID=A0A1Y0I7R7_9GAMM|nr:DUF3369 domain-containing protein [Oleiphilus messinensis]ARU55545.1 metal-dependent phosphohydrolase [Oleiphilus messinensis]
MGNSLFSKSSPENKALESTLRGTWKIAVVDDDPDVVAVTELVLRGLQVDNRGVAFLTASSAEQAKQLFNEHDDIAIAFIDVVMERENAGLELIRWIREECENQSTRLILRTGQPGQAPEESVIRDYDINDYKNKTELTSTRLKTAAYAAIRSYRDIKTLEYSRLGLEKVVKSTCEVLKSKTLNRFGSAVLEEITALLQLNSSAIYVAFSSENILHDTELSILAATGDFVGMATQLDSDLVPEPIRHQLQSVLMSKKSVHTDETYISYVPTSSQTANVLYVSFDEPLSQYKKNLLDIFSTNVALTFENLAVKEDIEATQKELMYVLGDAIEQRSKETGSHVRRVALICELLARALNLEEPFVQAIKHAAPLHDIGKIGIPEHILHKPGSLDSQEWEIMKTHARLGYDLLHSSKRVLARVGANIALYHHEKWDGSGYPNGLVGAAIPIEGRIMAVADVLDALGSKRSYKTPWSADEIKSFLEAQKGQHFDPEICDLALENFEEIMALRAQYPDSLS